MTDSLPPFVAPEQTPAWAELLALADLWLARRITDAFSADAARVDALSLPAGALWLDASKQAWDAGVLAQLLALARAVRLPEGIEALFAGAEVELHRASPGTAHGLPRRSGRTAGRSRALRRNGKPTASVRHRLSPRRAARCHRRAARSCRQPRHRRLRPRPTARLRGALASGSAAAECALRRQSRPERFQRNDTRARGGAYALRRLFQEFRHRRDARQPRTRAGVAFPGTGNARNGGTFPRRHLQPGQGAGARICAGSHPLAAALGRWTLFAVVGRGLAGGARFRLGTVPRTACRRAPHGPTFPHGAARTQPAGVAWVAWSVEREPARCSFLGRAPLRSGAFLVSGLAAAARNGE